MYLCVYVSLCAFVGRWGCVCMGTYMTHNACLRVCGQVGMRRGHTMHRGLPAALEGTCTAGAAAGAVAKRSSWARICSCAFLCWICSSFLWKSLSTFSMAPGVHSATSQPGAFSEGHGFTDDPPAGDGAKEACHPPTKNPSNSVIAPSYQPDFGRQGPMTTGGLGGGAASSPTTPPGGQGHIRFSMSKTHSCRGVAHSLR